LNRSHAASANNGTQEEKNTHTDVNLKLGPFLHVGADQNPPDASGVRLIEVEIFLELDAFLPKQQIFVCQLYGGGKLAVIQTRELIRVEIEKKYTVTQTVRAPKACLGGSKSP
jgi:hypothetical protein